MERLTSRNEDCVLVNGHGLYHLTMTEVVQMADRLAAYEDTGREPEEVTALGKLFDYALKESKTLTEQLTLLHHIRELAEADRDGRVLILPCKLGTKVYRIRYEIADYPDEPDLEIADTWFTPEYREDIGKTVFLTRAEAERALKEMDGRS